MERHHDRREGVGVGARPHPPLLLEGGSGWSGPGPQLTGGGGGSGPRHDPMGGGGREEQARA